MMKCQFCQMAFAGTKYNCMKAMLDHVIEYHVKEGEEWGTKLFHFAMRVIKLLRTFQTFPSGFDTEYFSRPTPTNRPWFMRQPTLNQSLKRTTCAESVEWLVIGLTNANMNWGLEEWKKWLNHVQIVYNITLMIVTSMDARMRNVVAMDVLRWSLWRKTND